MLPQKSSLPAKTFVLWFNKLIDRRGGIPRTFCSSLFALCLARPFTACRTTWKAPNYKRWQCVSSHMRERAESNQRSRTIILLFFFFVNYCCDATLPGLDIACRNSDGNITSSVYNLRLWRFGICTESHSGIKGWKQRTQRLIGFKGERMVMSIYIEIEVSRFYVHIRPAYVLIKHEMRYNHV